MRLFSTTLRLYHFSPSLGIDYRLYDVHSFREENPIGRWRYNAVSLCERPVAESSQVTILLPRRHVAPLRELPVVPQDFFQQLRGVHGHRLESVSVYGPVSPLLIDLKGGVRFKWW